MTLLGDAAMAVRREVQPRESTYGLENAWRDARARLGAIERWLDPATIRQLNARGVGPGWRCLEVGAGGGSIASWLCERVGPSGQVIAVDIDTRFLTDIDAPNLQVREQDIAEVELPQRSFDLVHLRLVLLHLAEEKRAEALRRMVAALKPGGWLIAAEMDIVSVYPDPTCDATAGSTFLRLADAHSDALRQKSFDPAYGRRLLGDLAAQGLIDLDAEGHAYMCRGGSAGATAWRLTFEQLREPMIASGAVTEADVAAGIEFVTNPHSRLLSQIVMAAWGRTPE